MLNGYNGLRYVEGYPYLRGILGRTYSGPQLRVVGITQIWEIWMNCLSPGLRDELATIRYDIGHYTNGLRSRGSFAMPIGCRTKYLE